MHCVVRQYQLVCLEFFLLLTPQAIEKASIKAADLNTQLRAMAEQAQPGTAGSSAAARSSSASPSSKDGGHDSTAGLQLPGLQDLRGQWSGSFQAYGGGGGATSCDFDLRGQGWQWGSSYALDALVGAGSYHSEEGLQLQEVRVGAAGRGRAAAVPTVLHQTRCSMGRRAGQLGQLDPSPALNPNPSAYGYCPALLHPFSLCSGRGTPSCQCAARCWVSTRTPRCCLPTSP